MYKEYSPSALRPEDIIELVNVISSHRPDVRQTWANVALEWALQLESDPEEPGLCEESFSLFLTLNTDFTFRSVKQLSLSMFKFMAYSTDISQQNLVSKFFFNLSPEAFQDKQSGEFLVNIGSILLQTPSIFQFHVGLKLLEHISKDVRSY